MDTTAKFILSPMYPLFRGFTVLLWLYRICQGMELGMGCAWAARSGECG